MGISSSKTKTKSTQTTAPSTFAQPYVSDAAATLKPGYEESLKTAQSYEPALQHVSDYFGSVLNGDYFNNNPYLDQVVQSSNRDITDTVNSQFMPRFGSAYHAKALARELADNEARLRFANYGQERQYQTDAAHAIPGVATAATALPLLPGQGYSSSVSDLLGRYLNANGTGTTKQSGGLLGQILGAGIAGWASGGFAH